jgi:hypothetical protein
MLTRGWGQGSSDASWGAKTAPKPVFEKSRLKWPVFAKKTFEEKCRQSGKVNTLLKVFSCNRPFWLAIVLFMLLCFGYQKESESARPEANFLEVV